MPALRWDGRTSADFELFRLGRGPEAQTGHLAKLTLTPFDGETFAAVQPVVVPVGRAARIRDVDARHTANRA